MPLQLHDSLSPRAAGVHLDSFRRPLRRHRAPAASDASRLSLVAVPGSLQRSTRMIKDLPALISGFANSFREKSRRAGTTSSLASCGNPLLPPACRLIQGPRQEMRQ